MALVTRLYAGVCLSVQVIDNQFSFYGGNRRLHTTKGRLYKRQNIYTNGRHLCQSIRRKVSSETCSGPLSKVHNVRTRDLVIIKVC